ncbi:transposase [Thioalkalivibrio sp. ALJ2]|uniref:REP-associated tyrosine transposase n=1 Tax=Thioalkalivibrio sp. ALJ2 TaxID=1261622 RepID=UPI0003811B71|nr:transposase [Thioalkalivibrio sp. ALJ2]
MTDYRRVYVPGGTYFFTVNAAWRRNTTLLTDHIDALRDAFREVRRRHPVVIDAMVVLPEHLHCIWRLPEGDTDFSRRWRLIKARFSRSIAPIETRTYSRARRGERGIWQRRFWERCIRDERDWARHVDYIHYNPVRHGWVRAVADWPYSSFHRFVRAGVYPADWGGVPEMEDWPLGERDWRFRD